MTYLGFCVGHGQSKAGSDVPWRVATVSHESQTHVGHDARHGGQDHAQQCVAHGQRPKTDATACDTISLSL